MIHEVDQEKDGVPINRTEKMEVKARSLPAGAEGHMR
jgi:hypothetical protein